jgi:hypothetical protein
MAGGIVQEQWGESAKSVHTRAAPLSKAILVRNTGEMWIDARIKGKTSAKAQQTGLTLTSSIAKPAVGICGWTVDDVWAQMYESNQPSKHYNRFS